MTNYIRNANLAAAQKLGGAVRAIQQKELALLARQEYNKNPKLCQYCKTPILAPLHSTRKLLIGETKKKKFCNRSCAAKYNNNRKGTGAPKINNVSIRGISTPKDFTPKVPKPPKERNLFWKAAVLPTLTKGDIFARCKNWQSARTLIRMHAAIIIESENRVKQCIQCGYVHHVEICHIKAVSNFEDVATVGEINASDNLILLCCNHHWEFDHGILKL